MWQLRPASLWPVFARAAVSAGPRVIVLESFLKQVIFHPGKLKLHEAHQIDSRYRKFHAEDDGDVESFEKVPPLASGGGFGVKTWLSWTNLKLISRGWFDTLNRGATLKSYKNVNFNQK